MKPWVLALALSALSLPSVACYGIRASFGASYQDPRRFTLRPDKDYSIEPIAKVNERLHGLYVFGFFLRPPNPEELRDEYLKDPDHMITNWQVSEGTYTTLLLDYIFTIPYCQVSFDVVSVK